MVEPEMLIPRQGKGEIKGGRKQLETGQTAEQYLKILQTDPQYTKEQALANEDWLTLFSIHLEKINQIINDNQSNDNACFLPGSYLPSSRAFGSGGWARGYQQAYLGKSLNLNSNFRSLVCVQQ